MRSILISLFLLYFCLNGNHSSNGYTPGKVNEGYLKDFLSWNGIYPRVIGSVPNQVFVSNALEKDSDDFWNVPAKDTMPFPDSLLKVGYRVEKILPAGHVLDGSVDYTSYLQKALNTYNILIFPGYPILVNEQGLHIPSNRKILFLSGSKLVLMPNNKNNYKIIYINNQSNVSLVNPVIVGDRYGHIGTEGEWGMGISIYSSNNIQIDNADISNCWGDGIYIGQSVNRPPSSNITITDAYCHENRRNGITLVSGINIRFLNPKAINSNGTFPMAGIDIEPNSPEDELKNILIQKPYTGGNRGKGIQIGLGKLVKNGVKPVSIEIDNHLDVGSNTAMVLSCSPGSIGNKLFSDTSSEGYIRILSPVWKHNESTPLRASGFRTQKILLEVTNPQIIDSANNALSSIAVKSVLKNAIGKGGAINIKD